MFRAFSFVLAIVLCTFGWSTAHAAYKPRFIKPLIQSLNGGWGIKDGKFYLAEPIKYPLPLNGKYERGEWELPRLRDVVGYLGWPSLGTYVAWENWQKSYSGNDHKDADRDRAY